MIRMKDILSENADNPLPAEQCLLDDGYYYAEHNGKKIEPEKWEAQKTYRRKEGFHMKKILKNWRSTQINLVSVIVHIDSNKLIISVGSLKQIIGFPQEYTFNGCSDLKKKIQNMVNDIDKPKEFTPFNKLYSKPRTKKDPYKSRSKFT